MTNSKTKTAVGMIAACAASSTAITATAAGSGPLTSSSSAASRASAVGPCNLLHKSSSLTDTPSLLDRIPRGGNSPASASAEATTTGNANVGNTAKEGDKKRKKKKKSSKTPKSGSSSSSSTFSSSQSSSSRARPQAQQQHDDHTPTPGDSNNKAQSSSQAQNNDSDNDHKSSNFNSPLPPAAQTILSQTCHYDVLGITKSATSIQIQKAYRRRCVLTHPDKTQGDRSAFDKVSEAYDVLSCEKKRAVYDRFGKEGLEGGVDVSSGMRGSGFGGGGASFFGGGSDVFREFFGANNPFSSQQQQQQQQSNPFRRAAPRNRDLRYQLEVTLEELYKGTTKHVAIQQPNPLRPHFPLRKEVEVTLTPGMMNGQSVRLSGVVDSIADAAPADIIFLVRERRHPIFTRGGSDLAIEVKISYAESIVGFKRRVRCLDGKEIVIGSPFVKRVVKKEELVDVPALPEMAGLEEDEISGDNVHTKINGTNITAAVEEAEKVAVPEPMTKTTTVSYHLPPSIIQTGDVHVLKGHGMPKKGGHDHGDLYVQYVVETVGASSSVSSSSSLSKVNADNLTPEERVELARLLSKLEGNEDPTKDIVHTSNDNGDATSFDNDQESEEKRNESIHHLAMASASDFGKSSMEDNEDDDEHLHHDDDGGHHHGMPHGFGSAGDAGAFFQRAFSGRSTGGFGGPFGMGGGNGNGGGFHYFSSSSGGGGGGGGYGYQNNGREEEDHKVDCNQM